MNALSGPGISLDATSSFHRVLVPLDGSALAEQALEELEHVPGPPTEIVLLAATNELLSSLKDLLLFRDFEPLLRDLRKRLEPVAQRLRERGWVVRCEVRDAFAADAILDTCVSEECDLVLMSTHGRTGFQRWWHGSVAEKVVARSECPVWLVRPQHPAAPDRQEGAWVDDLLRAECFDHPVTRLSRLETHISWVILTGPYAYKIKKPVNFGFLDYTQLDRRRFYCEEELRLNRRLAPELYLDVVPITQGPRVGGAGPVLDYAVKMREFDQAGLLDGLAQQGRLRAEHIDEIAEITAAFHLGLPGATLDSGWGTFDSIRQPVLENFDQLGARVDAAARDQAEAAGNRLQSLMQQRLEQGWVRECHGDLHLKNMVEVDGRVVIFDGIEFNPNFIWIDVMNEIAFFMMDLEHRGYRGYAFRFLNRYLEQTGDFAGLPLLDYYRNYRALVRAKVAALRLSQGGPDAAAVQGELDSYLRLAQEYTSPRRVRLVITRGVSGSGKTFQSQRLLESEGLVRLRSDVERKRLFGMRPGDCSHSPLGAGIYTPQASGQTYARLADLARSVLQAGFPVVVDATFLHREERQTFRDLAHELQIPFSILELTADPEILRDRLLHREREASEADLQVLASQLAAWSPLDTDERGDLVSPPCEEVVP